MLIAVPDTTLIAHADKEFGAGAAR
jgi:hypothetical protein